MNSAISDRPKSTQKIMSDQKARRFRLKLFQRRWFSGDSVKRLRTGATGTAGLGSVTISRSSGSGLAAMVSALPFFKVDAWIDQHIHQVRQDADQKSDQAEDEQRAEDHRIVTGDRRFEPQPSQTVERKDRFDDQ